MYSQRDPRWYDLKLGRSNLTIGNAGCLLTCCSMLLIDIAHKDMTPDVLNRWLNRNNKFVRNNEIDLSSDPFVSLGMKLVEPVIFCEDKAAPTDKIMMAIEDKHGVIVKVDFDPGGIINMHYIRILGIMEDDCMIADPWIYPANWPTHLMPRYALPEWKSPAMAIMRIAIFGVA